jgi:pantothenate kinase
VTPAIGGLAADIVARAAGGSRYLFAIAGPPGAGKSTLADALHAALEARAPGGTALVPMDGYHFDNAVLGPLGLLPRKGAPETFDTAGLRADLQRIRAGVEVAVPVFDRGLDLARAGARIVRSGQWIVLVEGNYLLLEDRPWDQLAPLFDRTLLIEVASDALRRRLVERWLHHGLGREAAERRADGNDMVNARLIAARSRPPDVRWHEAHASV